MAIKINEQRQGAVTVLKPDGPLIDADAVQFKADLQRVMDSSFGRMVVDMSAIPFVDSVGLEALVDITEELAKSGMALKLCATNKTIREVLELTAIISFFEHFQDVNSAVRSFL